MFLVLFFSSLLGDGVLRVILLLSLLLFLMPRKIHINNVRENLNSFQFFCHSLRKEAIFFFQQLNLVSASLPVE